MRSEKQKYKEIWESHDYTSRSAGKFAKYVTQSIDGMGSMIDLGCGDGTTIKSLWRQGISCDGLDITTEHIGDTLHCDPIEAPIWETGINDNEYDFTISTDVLEHMPPMMVSKAIREISRITKKKTIHCISTVPSVKKYCGHDVHLTVQPLVWWEMMFITWCDVEFDLISADDLRRMRL